MRRTPRTTLLCALLLAGCNRAPVEAYRAALDEQHRCLEELGDILARIEDEPSMTAARAPLKACNERCDASAARAQSLPRPTGALLQALEPERSAMETALQRLQYQVGRVKELPGGPAYLKRVGGSRFR